ncbi:hypothetical protein HPULCUR_005815 [Helicostylum pulchrum]|uniref:Transposase n=1 Tax=Helicostylum pulchrum TaxID=562976 RepID=A0ABP9Y052_9FUNG
MNVLDKNEMKGFFIAMDNCRVHHSRFVIDAISGKEEKRIHRINKLNDQKLFNTLHKKFLKEKSRSTEDTLSFGNGFTIDHGENNYDPVPEDLDSDEERPTTFWEEDLDKWVCLYLRALGRSKPSATLTTPVAISGNG